MRPRKYHVTDEDMRLIIALISERDRLYSEVSDISNQILSLQNKRAELKTKARQLSCELIGEKFEFNKDVIHSISRCETLKDQILRIDPEFYRINCKE